MIEKCNVYFFEKSYQYAELIDEASDSPHFLRREVLSRVYALAISVINAIALVGDIVYISVHSLIALGYSVVHLKSPFEYASSISHVWLLIAEFVRHLVGTVGGSLVGIISPKTARSRFLPPDQSIKVECDQNLTPTEAARLYKMCQIVTELFEEAGIDYCATGGTELGLERHGGIVPWDDDVDFAVLIQDKGKIEALRDRLEEVGLELVEIPGFGFKICDPEGKELPPDSNLGSTVQFKFPFIDICFFQKEGEKYVYSFEKFRTYYAGEYFTEMEWANKETQPFGPIQIKGVAKGGARKWVERAYGPSAMEYGYQPFSHKELKLNFPRKFILKYEQNGKCEPIACDQAEFESAFEAQRLASCGGRV